MSGQIGHDVANGFEIGGIFFGAVHDFGALFASLRHKGQTIATVIAENIDDTAKKLFCIFAYLTLVLVVAAFASIVANTFAVNLANATEASNLARWCAWFPPSKQRLPWLQCARTSMEPMQPSLAKWWKRPKSVTLAFQFVPGLVPCASWTCL